MIRWTGSSGSGVPARSAHTANIGAIDGAKGGEGLVPGGPFVGVARYGLGSDWLGGMVVAGQFPVCAERASPPLPLEPVQRVIGNRA